MDEMSDSVLRLEALRLANSYDVPATVVVDRAQQYYNFMKKQGA